MTGKNLKKHTGIMWDLMCGERYKFWGITIKFSFKRLRLGEYPYVCKNELDVHDEWEPVDGLWDSIEQWELIEKEDNDE